MCFRTLVSWVALALGMGGAPALAQPEAPSPQTKTFINAEPRLLESGARATPEGGASAVVFLGASADTRAVRMRAEAFCTAIRANIRDRSTWQGEADGRPERVDLETQMLFRPLYWVYLPFEAERQMTCRQQVVRTSQISNHLRVMRDNRRVAFSQRTWEDVHARMERQQGPFVIATFGTGRQQRAVLVDFSFVQENRLTGSVRQFLTEYGGDQDAFLSGAAVRPAEGSISWDNRFAENVGESVVGLGRSLISTISSSLAPRSDRGTTEN